MERKVMEKLSYRILLLLLIFCPLAFGTVEQWSLTIMEGLSFLATFLYLLARALKRQPLYKAPGMLPLSLFLGYMLIQVIPFPQFVIKLLSPNTYEIYQETLGVLDPNAWYSISVNKKATLQEFFRYASYVCIYFLTVQLLTAKERLKTTITVIISFTSALSIFSILQYYTSSRIIYWLREVNSSNIFGPYVNHNHYAGLIEMLLPLGIVLFIYYKPRVKLKRSWQEKIVDLFDLEDLNLHLILGLSTLFIGISLFVSMSRGGLISSFISVIFLVLFLGKRGKLKKKKKFFVFTITIFLISTTWFGWNSIIERFDNLKDERTGSLYEARLDFWHDSINIIKTYPLTGLGFNNFQEIYPRYRTFVSTNSVLHAHNDYLELLVEGGVVSFILIASFVIILLYKSWKSFKFRKERYSIYIFLGILTGILAVLIHSLTDFNFHIGANGFYFFVLAAILVSASHTKFRGSKATTLTKTNLKSYRFPQKSMVLVLLIISLFFNFGILAAKIIYAPIANINLNPNLSSKKIKVISKIARTSAKFDPLESKYVFALANLGLLQQDVKVATHNYKKAIHLQPLNGEMLQQYGQILSWKSDNKQAQRFLMAGMKNDQTSYRKQLIYTEWLLKNGKKEEAIKIVKNILTIHPHSFKKVLTTLFIHNINDSDFINFLPKTARAAVEYANYLVRIGELNQAEKLYEKAFDDLKNFNNVRNFWDYYDIYRFFEKVNKDQLALSVAQTAAEFAPHKAWPRIWAARIYYKQGIYYRALEEYETAVSIDPGNFQANQELYQIKKLHVR